MTQKTLPTAGLSNTLRNPFFRSLHDEIDRALERFQLGSFFEDPAKSGQLMPALDIAETDTAIEITAEIPGVQESDLDVSVTGSNLVLKGEKSSKAEEKDKDFHLVERRYGSFRRQIPLGFVPDEKGIAAEFKNGVLSLTIQKPKETVAATKKIEIAVK